MSYELKFKFAPAQWLPIKDRDALIRAVNENIYSYEGNKFECSDFELRIVHDVHNYFAVDLMQRIRMSDIKDEKLVVILPSPENAVFISITEALNKYRISCRNLHVFFLYEYANERGEVAPPESPYSRSGHFMRYFYDRLDEDLRMPMENIHFFTTGKVESYSKELSALGGADVAYTALSWSGGIGAIDAESYSAESLDEFLNMGSGVVTPMPEMIAHDSLRGMFGAAGDIGNVPPKAATVGPRDLMAAKEWIDLEYLVGCGGAPAHQKFPLRFSLFCDIAPSNPGSIMRLHKGTCYVSEAVAAAPTTPEGYPDLPEVIAAIRKKEEK